MQYIRDIDKEEIRSTAYHDAAGDLKFDPAVFEQRYMVVIRILNHPLIRGHIKNVLEFGVNDMKFFVHLKSLKHIEKIVQVDIDGDLLKRFLVRTEPLLADHLNRRETPLAVEVYKGSMSLPDKCLLGSDAIVGIEVIEHVLENELRDIPANIFSFVKPKIVIFTTPNREFNVMFPGLTGFRHDDHKFEWTRKEFEDWSNKICEDYPDYCVQFHGVGRGPESTEHLGSVSQLALFLRKDFLRIVNEPLPSELLESMDTDFAALTITDVKPGDEYELIHKVAFPFHIDPRTREQKVSDEANYHLSRFRNFDKYQTSEPDQILRIPLEDLLEFTQYKITTDLEELRCVLKKEYTIIANVLHLEPIASSEEEEEEKEDCDTYDDFVTKTVPCNLDDMEDW